MGCSVIVCQADDHQLIAGEETRSFRSMSVGGIDFVLATYPANRDQWGCRDDEWLEGIIGGVLAAASPNDVIFIADHDTIWRFSSDPRIIRAWYTLGDPEIGRVLELAFANDEEATIEVLGWFWENGLELPYQGLYLLGEILEKDMETGIRWEQIRKSRQIRCTLNWLVKLSSRNGNILALQDLLSLVGGNSPVKPDDDEEARRCFESLPAFDVGLLRSYCLSTREVEQS